MLTAGLSKTECSTGSPIRVFYETGVEIRITALRGGLQVQGLYHHHPWLCDTQDLHQGYLFEAIVIWDQLLDPDISAHERIAFIGSLAKEEGECTTPVYLSAADREQFEIVLEHLSITLQRPRLKGLVVRLSRRNGQSIGSLSCVSPDEISEKISILADRTNKGFQNMALWKRIALGTATDLALVLHLLIDTFGLGLQTIYTTQRKKK